MPDPIITRIEAMADAENARRADEYWDNPEPKAEDTDTRDDNDRRQDEDRRWGPRFFIPTFLLAFAGLLIPAAPTPIDDSLPSSGVHSPARGSDPGKDAWAGPLWTT